MPAKETLDALRDYARRMWTHTFAIVVAGFGAVLGTIALVVPAPEDGEPFVSTQLWVGLVAAGITISQFLAYRDVWRERRDARRELAARFDALRYRFRFEDLVAAPQPPDASGNVGWQLRLQFRNGGLEPMLYDVERVRISLAGNPPATFEDFMSSDGILLPGSTGTFFVPPIVPDDNQLADGEMELVVRYGHPSGGPSFRASHRLSLRWTLAHPGVPMLQFVLVGSVTHEPVVAPAA